MVEQTGIEFEVLSEDTAQAVRLALERQARLKKLTNAYLEFGVFQGYSMLSAYKTLEALDAKDVRLFGFDSFRGLPAPGPIDDDGYHREGMFSCRREEVEARLAKCGVDMTRITLVEGYYDQTLVPETQSKLDLDSADVVLIDCDFYESSKHVLEFISLFLVDGSILLFDDWNLFERSSDRGQRRAFREFLEATRMRAEALFSFGWHGQSFVIVKT
jgi:predicted O-methyltransferase YrrM